MYKVGSPLFGSYPLLKSGVVRSMVRSNNVLRKHPGFLRAARGAIEIYLHLDGHASETAQINGFHSKWQPMHSDWSIPA